MEPATSQSAKQPRYCGRQQQRSTPWSSGASCPECAESGGVCISDEVQTGFGRTGTNFWGFQNQGVTPDIVVTLSDVETREIQASRWDMDVQTSRDSAAAPEDLSAAAPPDRQLRAAIAHLREQMAKPFPVD